MPTPRFKLQPLEPTRRTFLAERNDAMIAEHPELGTLRAQILAVGGHEVCFYDHPHFLTEMVERGAYQSARSTLIRLRQRSRCHSNACEAWCGSPDTVTIHTGYALSDDGVWRHHSWLTRNGRIEETTARRTAYYGIALTPFESLEFCEAEAEDWVWRRFTRTPTYDEMLAAA